MSNSTSAMVELMAELGFGRFAVAGQIATFAEAATRSLNGNRRPQDTQ